MKIASILALLSLLLATQILFAQSVNVKPGIQDSLSKISSLIWKQKTDSARIQANDIFYAKFLSVLSTNSNKDIPLDSIYGITSIFSDDRLLRIFTWNVPLSEGTNKYFGFIQLFRDSTVVIPLESKNMDPADIALEQLTSQLWYGAIYYKLIQVEIAGNKAYTLLGWDGYSSSSNRKIIDIISIDPLGNIIFGMPVFKTDKGIKSRVVMEYAEKANMLLRYDYQSIMVKKRKKIKKENAWLIVMDRLIPMDPSMDGFRKYYVPAGDTYDGYIFRDGYWVLVEDIDVVNKVNQKE